MYLKKPLRRLVWPQERTRRGAEGRKPPARKAPHRSTRWRVETHEQIIVTALRGDFQETASMSNHNANNV